MPCKDALTTKVFTLTPLHTVEQALKELKKNKTAFAPVVEDGLLLGVFSIGRLLKEALPVSVVLGLEAGGGIPNVRIPNAPGMGKRLQRVMTSTVASVMDRTVSAVGANAPLEAAIREIAERAEPVCAVDAEGMFLGLVTDESVLAALEKDGGLE